jgi:hypothetical protein
VVSRGGNTRDLFPFTVAFVSGKNPLSGRSDKSPLSETFIGKGSKCLGKSVMESPVNISHSLRNFTHCLDTLQALRFEKIFARVLAMVHEMLIPQCNVVSKNLTPGVTIWPI